MVGSKVTRSSEEDTVMLAPSSPSPFVHEINRTPLLCAPAMTHCAATGPKATELSNLNLWNMIQNKPFPLLNWFSQVFCHRDRKLTNNSHSRSDPVINSPKGHWFAQSCFSLQQETIMVCCPTDTWWQFYSMGSELSAPLWGCSAVNHELSSPVHLVTCSPYGLDAWIGTEVLWVSLCKLLTVIFVFIMWNQITITVANPELNSPLL